MKPRKNDVPLAIGGVLACTSAATGLMAVGVYLQPIVIEAQAAYLASAALKSAEELAAERIQAALLALISAAVAVVAITVIAAVIAVVVVRYNRARKFTDVDNKKIEIKNDDPKAAWATGASLGVGVGCIVGGIFVSGITAFDVGVYVEQLNNAALIEPLSIAAGVTGGLAIACFIADYVINRNGPAEQAV